MSSRGSGSGSMSRSGSGSGSGGGGGSGSSSGGVSGSDGGSGKQRVRVLKLKLKISELMGGRANDDKCEHRMHIHQNIHNFLLAQKIESCVRLVIVSKK